MLNLLPPEIKSRHKVRLRLYSVTVFYIVIVAIFVLGPIAAITYNFVQSSKAVDIETEISQIKAQIGTSQDINNKLSFVENRIAGVTQFKEQRDWNDYLAVISSATPTPVIVTSISLENESEAGPTFAVVGKSGDRRSIVLYRDKLLDNKLISQTTFTALTELIESGSKSFAFSLSIVFTK